VSNGSSSQPNGSGTSNIEGQPSEQRETVRTYICLFAFTIKFLKLVNGIINEHISTVFYFYFYF
jgi:hypothetical protein